MSNKTCNNFTGNCCYKFLDGTSSGCKYEHCCDYQAPRDSRVQETKPILPCWPCWCGGAHTAEKHPINILDETQEIKK